MKKIILTVLIGLASVANAQHRHGHHHGGHWGNWVAPAIIGGAVTYALTRPQVVVPQQPIIVQQPYNYPPAPLGYHYENILDANCNCYRIVLVQNQP